MRPLPHQDLQHVLDHTTGLWEELRGNRIFVTGGTGFFGCWLLETFAFANDQLNLNAHLVALTRSPEAFEQKAPHLARHPAITLCRGDVRDFKFPEGPFSHVIHAGASLGGAMNSLEVFDTITQGTQRTLDFAVTSGAKKLLFTSSGAVYGKQPPDLHHIPETYSGAPDPSDPDSAYGEGKRAAELLCAIYHRNHGIETKIARCFAFLGPHLPLNAHFAIGNFIRNALQGGPIRVSGDGTPIRSYLYAADLAIWLWTILFKGHPALPYNVGSEESVTIAELARLVARTVKRNMPFEIALTPLSASNPSPNRYVCACNRSRLLGLKNRISLPEQIQRTIAWHHPYSLDTAK